MSKPKAAREIKEKNKTVAILGTGFESCLISAALAIHGFKVVVVDKNQIYARNQFKSINFNNQLNNFLLDHHETQRNTPLEKSPFPVSLSDTNDIILQNIKVSMRGLNGTLEIFNFNDIIQLENGNLVRGKNNPIPCIPPILETSIPATNLSTKQPETSKDTDVHNRTLKQAAHKSIFQTIKDFQLKRLELTLTPVFILAASQLMDFIIDAKIGTEMLEFYFVNHMLYAKHSSGGSKSHQLKLNKIPTMKSHVFQDKSMSLVEKRNVMRLFKTITEIQPASFDAVPDLDSFTRFMARFDIPESLSLPLKSPLLLSTDPRPGFALSLNRYKDADGKIHPGLEQLSIVLRSMSRFAPPLSVGSDDGGDSGTGSSGFVSPFLTAAYGTGSEVCQVLVRKAAVHGSHVILNCGGLDVSSREMSEGGKRWKVETEVGGVIDADYVFCEPEYLKDFEKIILNAAANDNVNVNDSNANVNVDDSISALFGLNRVNVVRYFLIAKLVNGFNGLGLSMGTGEPTVGLVETGPDEYVYIHQSTGIDFSCPPGYCKCFLVGLISAGVLQIWGGREFEDHVEDVAEWFWTRNECVLFKVYSFTDVRDVAGDTGASGRGSRVEEELMEAGVFCAKRRGGWGVSVDEQVQDVFKILERISPRTKFFAAEDDNNNDNRDKDVDAKQVSGVE